MSGRVAVVTGGSRDIGHGVVRALHAQGAAVSVFDVSRGDEPPRCVWSGRS